MTREADLISWKTKAWTDENMVSWYSARMRSRTGTDCLKNRLEEDLCDRFAVGKSLIDVGTGTGRGALPFARKGWRVTGVDSSEAMLEECRRLAEGIQIELRRGDVLDLPVEDASFDSLVSLNCIMHFPNWRQALVEWQRVVHPGGRLIFDFHSLDHHRAAFGADVQENARMQGQAENYVVLVSAEELISVAADIGLSVVDIVPYGAFLGGGNANFLLAGLESKHRWKRLLSWLPHDTGLLEFAVFLEQRLVSRLPPVVAGRFMAVFAKSLDAGESAARRKKQHELASVLRERISLQTISPFLALAPEDFKDAFNRHVQHSFRNFRLFEALLASIAALGVQIDLASFLAPRALERYGDWQRRRDLDSQVTRMARAASEDLKSGELATLNGVDFAEVTEYFLIEDLLTKYHKIFSGVRS